MIDKSRISVLIPTIGRSTLPGVVMSLLSKNAPLIGEIIIIDSGEIPFVGQDSFEMMMELSKALDIRVIYCREIIKSIGKTRWELINRASCDYSLFIDDDVILVDLIQNSLGFLYGRLSSESRPPSFVVPCCYVATDYLGIKYKTNKVFSLEEARSYTFGKDWVFPYLSYDRPYEIALRFCGTQCILFPTVEGKKAKLLERWKDGANREDIYFTITLASQIPGLLLTNALSFHLENTKQYREWKNKDEDIGYEEIISRDLFHYVENWGRDIDDARL